ncbi:hypothetical protein C0991_005572 [Blastosporella zonata]|nr:hypothetical protein C0991_005572 [Blastosporella zonata]
MPVLNPSRAKHVALVAQKLVTEKLVIPNRIGLYELPNLVTPGDIRRALGDKMRGVENVQLEYKAFRPTGKAVITMTRPEFVQENLRHLKPLSICGTRVQSVAQYGVESANAPRMRGVRGLEQAVERGVIDGNGLDGNFPNVTRNVVLWGLPGKTTAEEVGRAMGSSGEYKPGTKNGKPIVIKIDRCVYHTIGGSTESDC